MNNHWSEFRLRVNIDVPVETVYRAWATPGGLESWFLRKAIFVARTGAAGDSVGAGNAIGQPARPGNAFIQKGDAYEWYWHGYPDSLLQKGRILAANGKDQFRFSFSDGCPVNISLYRECDETIVELSETDLPEEQGAALRHYIDNMKGWVFYLTNLKSVLEGGRDLRNQKMELSNVITA
jgi:hypothetical protein